MENNMTAVAVGYYFTLVPAEETKGLDLRKSGVVRFENENWDLFKATTFEGSRQLDLLLDKYQEHPIKDYEIKPVVMSGELELVIPGYDKERDTLMFGAYTFTCAGKKIPFDFSGISWDVQQNGDKLTVSFETGRTDFLTNLYLDDSYESDYTAAGLRYNEITAEFLAKASSIYEFMVMAEVDGKEYGPLDISSLGSFSIKALRFDDGNKEFAVDQKVLDGFNLSMLLPEWARKHDEIDQDCIRQYGFILGRPLLSHEEYMKIDGQVNEMILDFETPEAFFKAYPNLKKYCDEPALTAQPYRVVVTETFTREVEILASDPEEAIEIAEELCNEGVIDLDAEDFSTRDVSCLGQARSNDLKLHSVYDENGKLADAGADLKEILRNVDGQAANKPRLDNLISGAESRTAPTKKDELASDKTTPQR